MIDQFVEFSKELVGRRVRGLLSGAGHGLAYAPLSIIPAPLGSCAGIGVQGRWGCFFPNQLVAGAVLEISWRMENLSWAWKSVYNFHRQK